MCKSECDHPELRSKDGKCSDKLIEKCHGKDKKHPCDEKDKKEKA